MSRVRDLIHGRDLFCVEETDPVTAVARRMAELHVGAILVLNGEELRGLFSERDLMKRVVLERLDPDRTPVSQVMSSNLATIDEMASAEDAMEMMQANNCRHLPVLRGSHVVGFLSMRDLMNFELARKTEELHHMRAYIHGVVGHFKGKILSWDVINESINDGGNAQTAETENLRSGSPYVRSIGPEFFEIAFKAAHEADPDAHTYSET